MRKIILDFKPYNGQKGNYEKLIQMASIQNGDCVFSALMKSGDCGRFLINPSINPNTAYIIHTE